MDYENGFLWGSYIHGHHIIGPRYELSQIRLCPREGFPTPHPPSEKCAKLKYCYYYIVTSLKRLG